MTDLHIRMSRCISVATSLSLKRVGAKAQKSKGLAKIQVAYCIKEKKSAFIDSLRVYVRGGAGGQGLPKYGGLGGKGGDVLVVANKKMTLKQVSSKNPTKRFTGGNGDNSKVRKLVGDAGADKIVAVPVGVCVKNDMGRIIGDLNADKQTVRVARGGRGGSPDNHFLGQSGEVKVIQLDLKLLADIGLVGFPNAGKSTFLSAVSRAAPKIASYPFTTIQPQLGIMYYQDHRQISVADLPGLIEGAHANRGMGHQFLKHVERTKLLLFIVDMNGFQLPTKGPHRTALETILLLNQELELYKSELLDKPAVLAINKVDTLTDQRQLDELKQRLKSLPDSLSDIDQSLVPKQFVQFDEVIAISAKYGKSVDELKMKLRNLLDYYADRELYRSSDDQLTLKTDSTDSEWYSRSLKQSSTKLV